jgi:hypothetical protein
MSGTLPIAPPPRELRIISHSNLYYWWPVWFVGFILAALTYLGGHRMAVVPAGTEAVTARAVEGYGGPRDVLVVPAGRHLPADEASPTQPHVLMATGKNLGGLFVLVLLVVIFVTNVPLRGLWSALTVLAVLVLALFFSLMGWWDPILSTLGLMHVYVNAFGYLSISAVLFAGWVLTTLLFDRRTYLAFTPGQFRVHVEIGAGETAFDSFGMAIQKRQDDVFRHYVLGLGSGDLVVKTGGANPQTFEVPNVLFVGWKLRMIETMLQEREVVGPRAEPTSAA